LVSLAGSNCRRGCEKLYNKEIFKSSQRGEYMIYRKYGKTDIEVSAIGFGGMRFENPDDIEGSAEIIKAAYDMGINYFDTAPGYCDDKSEEIVGTAIKEMKKTREEKPFYVSTKSMKSDPSTIRRECERSLKRLNVDYIDFYHVWCIKTVDELEERIEKGALKEFQKLKDEGLAKHICVSTHVRGSEVNQLFELYPFDAVLLGYSAMNFAYRQKGLQAAADRNRPTVVMNPLGGGLIPQHPDKFSFLKTTPDENIVHSALRFLLSDDRITVALVGFSNKDEVKDAVSAAENFQPLSDKQIGDMKKSLQNSFDQMCTSCQYCDICPQGIPVPKLMDTYNHYMLLGDWKDALDRLNYHWGIEPGDQILRKCTQCGKCESACTQKLPVIERIEEIKQQCEKRLQEKT
jgi:hypothetical protein